ncbi:uncharacterized protein LOC106013085 [Aplysia californica]|uniref:Uncharacterized protein LOC106013085 n=1 Tax=Aplysia californica TaxID=6500 RepID=A0ABM1W0M9_APLCA|nr:uncharacterized protein LOC106013085 [Aplysia californica]
MLNRQGVRVNTVCPAMIKTPKTKTKFTPDQLSPTASVEDVMAEWKMTRLRNGVMTAEYVAQQTMDLITDRNMNGAIVHLSQKTGRSYVDVEHDFGTDIMDNDQQ